MLRGVMAMGLYGDGALWRWGVMAMGYYGDGALWRWGIMVRCVMVIGRNDWIPLEQVSYLHCIYLAQIFFKHFYPIFYTYNSCINNDMYSRLSLIHRTDTIILY